MDANTTFTDEQWNNLVQGVAEAFDDLTLKRGFQYERMGSIEQLGLSEDRRLEAEVKEGAALCRVDLALDSPGGGSCDCKDRKPCRHMAAALMKLARLRGRPVSALANASASAAKARREAEEAASGTGLAEGGEDLAADTDSRGKNGGAAGRASDSPSSESADGGRMPNAAPEDAPRRSPGDGNPAADRAASSAPGRPEFLPGEAAENPTGGPSAKKPGIEEAALLAASGISTWNRRFEEAASSLAGRTRNPKFAELTLQLVSAEMPPFQPGIEALYRLNAHLFVLRTLSAPTGSGLSTPGYFAHLAVSETAAGIERILAAPLPDRDDPQVRERLGETLHFVRKQMLTEGREQDLFSTCYYRLLTRWAAPETELHAQSGADASTGGGQAEPAVEMPDLFALDHAGHSDTAADSDRPESLADTRAPGTQPETDPEQLRRLAEERRDFYESELQYLMDEERELGRALNRQAWLGANAWSRFCLGQDDRARKLLEEAADKPYFSPKKLPDFLSPPARAGEWERLADWLETFGPLLERARANLTDYGRLWDRAAEHLPDAEGRMWASLRGMLPHASSLYEAKLLERGNWEGWMDYQLSTGAEPSGFKVSDLAPIEKNAPELLLPFYHQAAERLVEQRSRDGYKAAVRLLKRLEKLYRKMKREDRWNAFMESFNARYGRLRALQEELKKGKLML
ncbi:SWIM zinc finger family protein [Saccharibacillus qingshengii]|uniref:SWIM zinc finger family protein n=1 Tax=Saccharibacillus qingshengii TaxID=1763540 RepID=UPI001553A912|nr:SWIM zinc finger family protein [Saccharibacillus qingshengii]